MPRIDLHVPFHERDSARSLGARWDNRKKLWYAPDGVDVTPFAEWIPALELAIDPNIRAHHYYVAQAVQACWQCRRETGVCALILPAGYEASYVTYETEEDCWQGYPQATVLSYVSSLSSAVRDTISSFNTRYRPDYSRTVGARYWMNHCEYCNAKIGDFSTIEDYGAPFRPESVEDAKKILLIEIGACFIGTVGSHTEYSSGMEFLDYMTRLNSSSTLSAEYPLPFERALPRYSQETFTVRKRYAQR